MIDEELDEEEAQKLEKKQLLSRYSSWNNEENSVQSFRRF